MAPPTPWDTAEKTNPTWQLIQVDWDKTNTLSAKTDGTYLARRFRLNPEDVSSRAPVDCRFSPDTWEWLPDEHKHVPRYVKHDRFALASQKNPHLKWPLRPINLAQDLIAGPIDFTPRKPPVYTQDGPPESHRIANTHWSILEDRAREFRIDTTNIRRTPPNQAEETNTQNRHVDTTPATDRDHTKHKTQPTQDNTHKKYEHAQQLQRKVNKTTSDT